jgi:uncharacterized protein (TIRG00374 family)
VHWLLQLGVSLALLAGVVWWAGPAKLVQALGDADPRWLAPAALAFTTATVVYGVRWWVLLRPVGRVALRDAVLALMVAKAVNVVVPLHAGAVVRVQVLGRRSTLDRGALAGTVALEVVLDVACLVVLFLVLMPFIGGAAVTGGIWVLTAAATVAVTLVVVLAKRRGRRTADAADRGVLVRVRRGVDSIRAGFGAVRNPWVVAAAAALTFADWLVASFGYALFGRAFGLDVTPLDYVMVKVAANLATALPFTQSGIGPYEVAVAHLLVRRGAAIEPAGAYAVGAHALVLLTALVSGGVALVLLRLRPDEVFYLRNVPDTAMLDDRPSPRP